MIQKVGGMMDLQKGDFISLSDEIAGKIYAGTAPDGDSACQNSGCKGGTNNTCQNSMCSGTNDTGCINGGCGA